MKDSIPNPFSNAKAGNHGGNQQQRANGFHPQGRKDNKAGQPHNAAHLRRGNGFLHHAALHQPYLPAGQKRQGNGGRHHALICGCHYADGDYIVFIDDDQQCPADRLWDLMDPLLNGDADVAIAKYPHKTQSAFKNFGSKVNDTVANWLLGKDKDLKFSNFSVMKRFVKDEVIKYKNPYPYLSGLMLRSTKNVVNVEMEERERTIGVGHYSFRKSFALWMNSFTAFSVKPLRFATTCGIAFAFIGMLLVVYTVVHKLVNPNVAIGYSSLMSMLLFIGGMIMFMLGLIGEYIGRIYISLNNSPQFVIREIYGQTGEKREEQ